MKIKKFLFSLVTAFVVTASVTGFYACSDTDNDYNASPSAKEGPIGFVATVDNNGGTRALPTTASNYLTQMKDFKVWGFFTNGTEYYLGTQGNGGIYITHTAGKGDWGYKTATDVAYWPSNALNFYGVSPSDNANYTFTAQTLDYKVPTDQSKQVDLLVALAGNQTKSTGGKVNMAFQHALSQITFKGMTKSSNLSVDVQSITVHNILDTRTVNFAPAQNPQYLTANALTGAAKGSYENYNVGLSKNTTVNSTTTAVSLTDANGALLLAPQTTTKWADNTSTTDANTKHQTYLEITCKITSTTRNGDKTNVSYLVGSETAYGKTYVPIAFNWQPGKHYTYTLLFGVGKNDKGDETTIPIEFSVNVSDWTNGAAESSNVSF